jgi:hypothetical protein
MLPDTLNRNPTMLAIALRSVLANATARQAIGAVECWQLTKVNSYALATFAAPQKGKAMAAQFALTYAVGIHLARYTVDAQKRALRTLRAEYASLAPQGWRTVETSHD